MPQVPCEICEENPAMYVCKGCGSRVCSSCINLNTWRCKRCEGETQKERPEFYIPLKWMMPEVLFLLSFIIITIGALFIILATLPSGGTSSFGAVFLIGPVPIILGSGPQTLPILILALIVTICSILLFFYWHRKRVLIN